MFAVLAFASGAEGAPPPGLVAAIKIEYTDGSLDRIFTDASWAVSTDIPITFPALPTPSEAAPDVAATTLSPFGTGPWGNRVTLLPADSSPPNLTDATWIWTSQNAPQNAPTVGLDAFRKTVSTANTAASAIVTLMVDNDFSLYVDGKYVGGSIASADWTVVAKRYTVALDPAASHTFSVIAQNQPIAGDPEAANPAGLVAAIKIMTTDGTSQSIVSDATWLSRRLPSGNYSSPSDPAVASFISTPDSGLALSFAFSNATLPGSWKLLDTFDALNAESVPTGPFDSTTPPSDSTSDAPPPDPSGTTSNVLPTKVIIIIGAAAGGVAVLGLVLALLLWRCRRKNAARRRNQIYDDIFPLPQPSKAPSQSNIGDTKAPQSLTVPVNSHRTSQISIDHFPNPYSPRPWQADTLPPQMGQYDVRLPPPTAQVRYASEYSPPPQYRS